MALCLLATIAGLLEGIGISTAAPLLASMGVEGGKSGPIHELTGTIMGVIDLIQPDGFRLVTGGACFLATYSGCHRRGLPCGCRPTMCCLGKMT